MQKRSEEDEVILILDSKVNFKLTFFLNKGNFIDLVFLCLRKVNGE